jgi:hypothetical protein
VRGSHRVDAGPDEGRLSFVLTPSERYGHLVGTASPVTWKQGQSNPVAYVPTKELFTTTSAHALVTSPSATRTRSGNRRRDHHITIKVRDLGDEASARLFVALLAQAASTGCLHEYTSTLQVREYRSAHNEVFENTEDYGYGAA